MSRLDDIQRRIDERMADIDRKINDVLGEGGSRKEDQRVLGGTAHVSAARPSPASFAPPPMPPAGGAVARLKSLVTPLNPDFLDWCRGARRSMVPGCGLAPTTCDLSYFHAYRSSGRIRRGAFEPRYDMRDGGLLPPVRNQGPHGTCWAHAALASLETSIKRSTGEMIDLSENNLANLHGFPGYFNYGGNFMLASAYLLRWDGPVLERDDPYGHAGASRSFPPVKHVQSVRMLPPMCDASDTEGIKAAVKTAGAVWASYCHTNDPQVLRPDTAAFYHGGSPDPGNHAVAIVGWDDDYPASNFAVQPPGNGAWIVRNSWGEEFGDAGYFYVSYHDSTFAKSNLNVVFCDAEPVGNYDDVLQYDYFGMIASCGNGERGTAANMFNTVRDTSVEAVGFYALSPETRYRISVYVGCEPGNPSSGALAGTTEGACEWAGYATIKLQAPARVPAGSRFSVVVELETPGCRAPFAVETAIPGLNVDADVGQSFFLCEGKWIDLTMPPEQGKPVEPGMLNNFCCKAYVNYSDGGARFAGMAAARPARTARPVPPCPSFPFLGKGSRPSAKSAGPTSAFGFSIDGMRRDESVRKVGLCVGLNTVDPAAYPGYEVPPLSGCIADVERLLCVLGRFEFETAKLLDSDATCANLYNTIKGLTSQLQPGDLFVLHVSGHGGRENRQGDLRENWCLYDGLAWDSDIVWLFSRFRPGVRILVINDQCHSGGIFQAARGDNMSPFGELCRADGRPADWNAAAAVSGANFPMLIQFAGCRAEQSSIDGLTGGTWTQALVNTLDSAISQNRLLSYREWFDYSFANPSLRRGRQDPQWVESACVTDKFRGCTALC